MPSDPPIEPPNDETTAEPIAAVAEPAAAAAAPVVPVEPPSRAKEWAVAVAIMIVFALICAQFVMFLRSNPLGGVGP